LIKAYSNFRRGWRAHVTAGSIPRAHHASRRGDDRRRPAEQARLRRRRPHAAMALAHRPLRDRRLRRRALMDLARSSSFWAIARAASPASARRWSAGSSIARRAPSARPCASWRSPRRRYRANTPLEIPGRGSDIALDTLYILPGRAPDALPPCDLVIVAAGESDANRPVLDAIGRLTAQQRAGPERRRARGAAVARAVAAMTQDVPGLLAPMARRLGRAAIAAGR